MSDEEQSQNSSPYTSEVEEEELELEEYGEAEAEVEVGSEGEESEEEEDGESEDESEEEEEEEGEQEDAEGDEEDDDGGDFEAALENMEAMEEEPQEYEDTSKLEVKVETAAEKRRAQFTTRAPYPRTYTIEPICALPHPTATHCLAASACMSYLVTGSEDGFVRCYDFFAGVNGKTYLTAPQRHHCGIGEGTMKAGVLKMWWESYGGEGEVLSAVHSIVLEGDALWGLSGTASGHVNLTTIRHDPGRRQHSILAHKGPVSCLALVGDEQAVLSAGWDGETKQWDLNTGQMVRVYGTGGGAQVVSVGIRPMGEGDGGSSDSSLFGDEEVSMDVVMTAQIDGQVLLWDRRVGTRTMRLEMGEKSPPWCVSACWSSNGHEIYAGRRNGTIDVWDIRGGGRVEKTLRNPASSGPVTCVVGFPDGQHLACASQDNIRLWKVSDEERRGVPFKIIAGHHGGVISDILVSRTSRFMVTASGNRGWFWLGESTKTVLVHDMSAVF